MATSEVNEMPVVSRQQKILARRTALTVGAEKPPVFRYWDENRKSSVYVLEAINRPQDGIGV